MLSLFGMNYIYIFKIHNQEKKWATYTSNDLKKQSPPPRQTMAHGITCTQLLGTETKNENDKGGQPGWPSQNEDD